MFFTISLYIALAIFGLGLLYKVSTWFRYSVGGESGEVSPLARLSAAIRGIFLTVFSRKILTLLKVFALDVLLQVRTLRESVFRWIMHMAIFWGFVLLLLWHGLSAIFTAKIFPDFASTLNPFMLLRNVFGLLAIIGLGLAVYRRRVMKLPRLITGGIDRYAIAIVAVIMVSGFLLEATKISSNTTFLKMVDEYGDPDDEEGLKALKSYWVQEYSLVAPDVKGPFEEDVLEEGKSLHEDTCASCHSKPQSAFISYGVAKIIRPAALALDRAHFPTLLNAIHFLACFIGLAYLPFSKMFHIIASPVSLLVNAVMDKEESNPANIATRQVMELDACTHCGTCSLRCSVGMAFEEIPNVNILPSEKLASLKALAMGKNLKERELRSIQEGLYLCTNCHRCTVACPVGINLQDLWFSVREALLKRGYPELLVLSPLSFYRGLKHNEIAEEEFQQPLQSARKAIADSCRLIGADEAIDQSQIDKTFIKSLAASNQANTFSYCFTCTTCTSACPVVRNYENPREALGLVPHQIIHAAIVGVGDLIYTSNMLWDCLGCYQCQDHCPQGVQVTDVLYELKNLAIKHVNGRAPGN